MVTLDFHIKADGFRRARFMDDRDLALLAFVEAAVNLIAEKD